ncbi:MAG: hypothetical protein R2712_01745 [Vicinamibacterales bacterium]
MRLTILTLLAALAAAPAAEAQTPYVPYFGKNAIRYDKFDWHIYTTDHFEIYYYPEIEQHLERIAGYAESAYQHVSSELKHDLAFKVPLILFTTSAEFWQQNVIPGAAQEGVGAFAEPSRSRMVMPIDEPSDLLYRLITHELTHVFQFDIIPTGLIRRNMPLWTMEGMSDYMTGYWRPLDLMTVRDAAVTDIIPKMSEMQDYGGFNNPRLIYNLGHAAFEFMEARWGKEGVRQYVFALRRSVIGGSDDAYQEAFQMSAEEWDQQFDRYMKERFKPFRDKERPADYGRDLAPDPRKSRFNNVLSIEPSPSGDLIAGMTANSRDREYDIVLISTKDGEIIRNLTSGFDQSMGFEYVATPGGRWNSVPWMSWSPQGDRLAYFVRTEKDRSLIVQNVVTRKVEVRVSLDTIDAPESPDFSPDGRMIAFSGMQGANANLFTINLETEEIKPLTNDALPHYAPTWSPDGRFLVYLARVSGNDKLFRVNADGSDSRQITFGTHDEGGAQFWEPNTLIFSSTAVNPAEPIDPEVARNGQIYNLWTLNLETNELKQYNRRADGEPFPGGLGTRARVAPRLRHLPEGRLRPARARPARGDPDGCVRGLRRARPDHRLPGAAHPHAGAGQRQEERALREDVPRGPAAGGARRHERRRPVRRHAGHLHRRPGRPAVQPLCLVGVAVPHAVADMAEPRTPLQLGAAGLLADIVLLRPARRHLLRPGLQRHHRPRPRRRHPHHARRHGFRHLPVQPLPPRRSLRRHQPVQGRVQRPGPAALLPGIPGAAVRASALQQRHDGAARRRLRAGDDHLP